MNRIKHLILEARRRSLWQVLGGYLVSGWVVLQVVAELQRTAGLPPWVPPFALVHAFDWHMGQNLWILQRIGPVYEALGDTEKALAHYRRMVDQWADADPELQPRVREWRQRIALLEAGG